MTQVPTKVYETTHLPDKTKTAEVTDYTTLTSLCPYTETVTKGGSTYTTVKTSTEVRSNCQINPVTRPLTPNRPSSQRCPPPSRRPRILLL